MTSAPAAVVRKSNSNKPKCPHRITDYRHQLWIEEHRKAKQLAKKASFRVELGPQPKRAPFTVDTSKARSNIDVVRLCLQELGWKEVCTILFHFTVDLVFN